MNVSKTTNRSWRRKPKNRHLCSTSNNSQAHVLEPSLKRDPQLPAWSCWQKSKPLIQQVPYLSDLMPFSPAKHMTHTWLSAPTLSNLNSSFSLHIWLVKHIHIQNILSKWICKMCLFSLTIFGIWHNIDVCSWCKRHGRWWGSLVKRSDELNTTSFEVSG